MDEFELDDVDFDAIEKKNEAKIDQMNEEVLTVDADEDGCAGGACKI